MCNRKSETIVCFYGSLSARPTQLFCFLPVISVHSKTIVVYNSAYCLLVKQSPDPPSRQQSSLRQSPRNSGNTIEWPLGTVPAKILTPRLAHVHICTLTAHKRLSSTSLHTHSHVYMLSYTLLYMHTAHTVLRTHSYTIVECKQPQTSLDIEECLISPPPPTPQLPAQQPLSQPTEEHHFRSLHPPWASCS